MPHAGIILILGAGPNVGNSVASLFAQNKFKVALVGRSLVNGFSEDGYLEISADLADDASIPSIFQTVEQRLGMPNIVVYNGVLDFAFSFVTELCADFIRSTAELDTP